MFFPSLFLSQQRGRLKEENFIKKVKEMIVEEEKKRMPIAQGLPWTTDEPEVNPLFLALFVTEILKVVWILIRIKFNP